MSDFSVRCQCTHTLASHFKEWLHAMRRVQQIQNAQEGEAMTTVKGYCHDHQDWFPVDEHFELVCKEKTEIPVVSERACRFCNTTYADCGRRGMWRSCCNGCDDTDRRSHGR